MSALGVLAGVVLLAAVALVLWACLDNGGGGGAGDW
jgi:hypothetical protein